MIYDDWQKEAIEHEGDLLLATGRQVGKTFVMSHKCGKYLVNHLGARIIIASLTEDQAKLIIVMILDYLQKNHPKLIAKGKNKPTLNKITLTNGATALARPVGTTGDAMRGFTGDVLVLDEVARFNELIMLSAKPTLASTGGQIWLCSTFFGRQGYFYECFLNKDGRFKVIHASTEEVYKSRKISEEWTEERRDKAIKFLENEKRALTDLQYAQEYLGLAVEELRQFFPDVLISKCCSVPCGFPNHSFSAGDRFLGVDVAQMGGDETTFISMLKKGEGLSQIGMELAKRTRLTETIEKIKQLDSVMDYRKIYIDDGGVGAGVYDVLLKDDQVKRKVIAINNARRNLDRDEKQRKRLMKEDLYSNLLRLMEAGLVELFTDDRLMASLKSIQYEYKDNKIRIYGAYSHLTEALVRSCWCSYDKHYDLWVAY